MGQGEARQGSRGRFRVGWGREGAGQNVMKRAGMRRDVTVPMEICDGKNARK